MCSLLQVGRSMLFWWTGQLGFAIIKNKILYETGGEGSMEHCYESEHYVFHYEAGSKAEQDMRFIAANQETCYRHITSMLGVSKEEKIHYYLYPTPEAVGQECQRRFGEYTPFNGCTASENEILAVYNQNIQCIGIHEDTHILMFTLGFSKSSFLEEGIACAMDALWWGIDNAAWVAYYRKNKMCPSVSELLLLSREAFYAVEDHIAYPLAGAFTSYLLMRFGKGLFRQYYLLETYNATSDTVFGCSLREIETDFFSYINLLTYDESVLSRISELLEQI